MKPRAIIFSPYITAFGGVERLMMSLASAAKEVGFNVCIAAFQCTVDLSRYAQVPIETLSLDPRRTAFSEARALSEFLRSPADRKVLLFDLKSAFYAALSRLDDFALHLTDPPSLLPQDVSKFAFSNRKIFPQSGASNAIRLRGQLAHTLNRRGARRATSVVVMTQRIASEVKKLYGVDAAVVRPGIAPRSTKSPRGERANDAITRLLTVSRLEPTKRIALIIEALARSVGAFHLDVVGSGPELERLRALTQKLDVARAVTFHGHVSDSDLDQLYAEADVFVMPAVQGYGLPALEALARGVPVILHSDSGVSEILRDTPWARTISSHDPADLAAVLESFSIEQRSLDVSTLPSIPTERTWSLELMKTIGWL